MYVCVYIRIYYMHLMYVCMHAMANCVYVVVLQETEQLLVSPHGEITCSVPLRGSIPLKWSSPVHMKYEPIQTLALIFTYIHSYMLLYIIFVGIIFINLVDNKKDQGKLGVAFKVCTYVCKYVCMYLCVV